MGTLKNYLAVLIPLALAVYCIISSIFDFDSFFDSEEANPVVRLVGRTGARIFYFFLGIFFIFVTIILFIGIFYDKDIIFKFLD